MKRIAVLIVVVAAGALSAQAGAANFKGSVVARDSARHAVAVALRGGTVRTVRVQHLAALGARVNVHAALMPDGTFRASKVSASGRASTAKVHGTVVRRSASKMFLSAGGTVLVVHSSHADSRLSPGRSATMEVKIEHGGLHGVRVLGVGATTVIKVEGAIASLSPLKITIDQGATIELTVPAALTLPTGLAVGDQVEAIVSFADGTYTLVTIQTDQNGQENNGETEVEGTVTALTDTSITVDPGKGGTPVVFAIPAGSNLNGVKVGDKVEAKGETVNGTLTLTRLKAEDDNDNGDGDGGDNGHHGHHHHGGGGGHG